MPEGHIVDNYFAVNYSRNDQDDLVHFLTHIETGLITEDLNSIISPTASAIYTSSANACILRNYFKYFDNVVAVEFGKSYQVFTKKQKMFIFTIIKSHYNCGSMVLIARGDFGTIIYTGYSTVNINMFDSVIIKEIIIQKSLTKLFLDCSYCNNELELFSLLDMINILTHFFRTRKNRFYIHVPIFGLEDVLASVVANLKEKMSVDERRMILIENLGLTDYFTTDSTQSRLHIISQDIIKRKMDDDSTQLVYIKVAKELSDDVSSYSGFGKIHYFVIYPHCSKKDCTEIISHLKPLYMIPLKNTDFDEHSDVVKCKTTSRTETFLSTLPVKNFVHGPEKAKGRKRKRRRRLSNAAKGSGPHEKDYSVSKIKSDIKTSKNTFCVATPDSSLVKAPSNTYCSSSSLQSDEKGHQDLNSSSVSVSITSSSKEASKKVKKANLEDHPYARPLKKTKVATLIQDESLSTVEKDSPESSHSCVEKISTLNSDIKNEHDLVSTKKDLNQTESSADSGSKKEENRKLQDKLNIKNIEVSTLVSSLKLKVPEQFLNISKINVLTNSKSSLAMNIERIVNSNILSEKPLTSEDIVLKPSLDTSDHLRKALEFKPPVINENEKGGNAVLTLNDKSLGSHSISNSSYKSCCSPIIRDVHLEVNDAGIKKWFYKKKMFEKSLVNFAENLKKISVVSKKPDEIDGGNCLDYSLVENSESNSLSIPNTCSADDDNGTVEILGYSDELESVCERPCREDSPLKPTEHDAGDFGCLNSSCQKETDAASLCPEVQAAPVKSVEPTKEKALDDCPDNVKTAEENEMSIRKFFGSTLLHEDTATPTTSHVEKESTLILPDSEGSDLTPSKPILPCDLIVKSVGNKCVQPDQNPTTNLVNEKSLSSTVSEKLYTVTNLSELCSDKFNPRIEKVMSFNEGYSEFTKDVCDVSVQEQPPPLIPIVKEVKNVAERKMPSLPELKSGNSKPTKKIIKMNLSSLIKAAPYTKRILLKTGYREPRKILYNGKSLIIPSELVRNRASNDNSSSTNSSQKPKIHCIQVDKQKLSNVLASLGENLGKCKKLSNWQSLSFPIDSKDVCNGPVIELSDNSNDSHSEIFIPNAQDSRPQKLSYKIISKGETPSKKDVPLDSVTDTSSSIARIKVKQLSELLSNPSLYESTMSKIREPMLEKALDNGKNSHVTYNRAPNEEKHSALNSLCSDLEEGKDNNISYGFNTPEENNETETVSKKRTLNVASSESSVDQHDKTSQQSGETKISSLSEVEKRKKKRKKSVWLRNINPKRRSWKTRLFPSSSANNSNEISDDRTLDNSEDCPSTVSDENGGTDISVPDIYSTILDNNFKGSLIVNISDSLTVKSKRNYHISNIKSLTHSPVASNVDELLTKIERTQTDVKYLKQFKIGESVPVVVLPHVMESGYVYDDVKDSYILKKGRLQEHRQRGVRKTFSHPKSELPHGSSSLKGSDLENSKQAVSQHLSKSLAPKSRSKRRPMLKKSNQCYGSLNKGCGKDPLKNSGGGVKTSNLFRSRKFSNSASPKESLAYSNRRKPSSLRDELRDLAKDLFG